ncbi:FAD-binding oxidoreductase [Pararhodobacter oceanensis]|uniref:FAD-linked oxidase n=1 Tax=Pararhodobacter oceanensis TaxID=2172121 RepID=A0A2T8HVN3_9RHOB|nr:FAD-binding oxidoreductase [Pararhodobacter oceanensis]PVH29392.1 FAD-linked oxidase [Pararhodobacter oceanensis]
MTADIAACRAALAHLDIDDNPKTVRQKSRDFFWYSPILKEQLEDLTADLVIAPRSVDEVVEVLATCWKHNVPVTTRGAGTGNYGQAMPLFGGVVLHMKHMNEVLKIGADYFIAQGGAVIGDIEQSLREEGKEIRLFPSTMGSATIGGFVAGGSSGVGAIRWGGLRNPANIRRLRLVTMEETPRVLDLIGETDISKAAHAYGVNGVIVEVEMPADPAIAWIDVIIGVDSFEKSCELALLIGDEETLCKRMLSNFEAEIPQNYFGRHRPLLQADEAMLAVTVSKDCIDRLAEIVTGFEGATLRVRYDQLDAGTRLPAVFELAWNHTTLRALRTDPTITYLQMMLARPTMFETLRAIKSRFGDELMMHFEFTRFSGVVTPVGIPLVRHTSNERLEEIIQILELEIGAPVFNPHRITLEEGGMKKTNPHQLAFKRQADPKGLMNPGKMIAWDDPDWAPTPGKTYLFAE